MLGCKSNQTQGSETEILSWGRSRCGHTIMMSIATDTRDTHYKSQGVARSCSSTKVSNFLNGLQVWPSPVTGWMWAWSGQPGAGGALHIS